MTSRTIEMEQTTDINSLPIDVIVTIFKLLSREDREKLSLVNKRFHAIYKYQAGLKFAFVLDLLRLTKVADGMKILRENQRPFDQLTIIFPTLDCYTPSRALICCQQILSDLEESISRETAQKVEYIVLDGPPDFFMVFLRITKLFPRLKSIGYTYGEPELPEAFMIKKSPYTMLDEKLWDFYTNQVEDLIALRVKELVVFIESYRGFSRCINHLLKICPNIEKIRCVELSFDYEQDLVEEMRCIDQKSYRSIERTFEVRNITTFVHNEWIEHGPIRLFNLLEEIENHHLIYKITADDLKRGKLRRLVKDTRKRPREE